MNRICKQSATNDGYGMWINRKPMIENRNRPLTPDP